MPIKTDTKARLELQGLTGGAAVALIGGAPDARRRSSGKNGAPPTIDGRTSQIQNLLGECSEHFREGGRACSPRPTS